MAASLPKIKFLTENNLVEFSETNAMVAKKLNYLFEKDLLPSTTEITHNKTVKTVKSPSGLDSSRKLNPAARSLSPKENRD